MVGPYSRVIHKNFIYTSAVEVSCALAALTTQHGPEAPKAPKAPPTPYVVYTFYLQSVTPSLSNIFTPIQPKPSRLFITVLCPLMTYLLFRKKYLV